MGKFFKNNWIIIAILFFALFLRLYKINSVPVSLFGDELDLGYHAYSILKTGRDYSGNFMPLHFQSLAEWRTPLYLYAAVPTVSLFGITPLGVRLPAVIFGVLSIYFFYLLIKKLTNNDKLALWSSFFLSVSPWHLQYSRAGFEVTMLLLFLLAGLYFFFKDLKGGKYLPLGFALLLLTPLIYSTAKLFTPFLLLFLLISYRKDIFSYSKKYLMQALVVGILLGGLTSYATLFSGGSQRFNYISVFSDPITIPEIGVSRLEDSIMRGETGTGIRPKLFDRVIHNKFTFWGERIANNILQSLGTDFLFINGDPNPRHMMDNMGQFYKIDSLLLIIGLVSFFVLAKEDKKLRRLMLFWIIAGIIPAAITRDGGNHGTRLILILPPLIFLISSGFTFLTKYYKYIYLVLFAVSFVFYLHNYYVHYPWDSERWWHAGWKDAITTIKEVENNYDRVFITMSDEPAWIFFAAYSQFDPKKWHKGFPMEGTYVDGFGGVSYIDKYYFGSIDEEGATIYDLSKFITNKDLYLASAKEIPWNLILEPGRIPSGLKLIKAISYPSGEPHFYLFTKNE